MQQYLDEYKRFLATAEAQHKKTIEDAATRLEALILQSTRQEAEEVNNAPQSAWVTGTDGEKFLMLNEAAVQQFNRLFEGFREIIELLAKQEKASGA